MAPLASMFGGTPGAAQMFSRGNPFPQGFGQPPAPQGGSFPSGNLSIGDPRTMELLRGGPGQARIFSHGNPFAPTVQPQPAGPATYPPPSGNLSMSDPRTMDYLRAGPARNGLAALLAGNHG